MANLDVVDRIENSDQGSVTLLVKDRDNPDDVGAYYHYADKPPAHAKLSAATWAEQIAAHAIGLEARARGLEIPTPHPIAAQPGQLGAAQESDAALSSDEQTELEAARAQQASADQVARDRAELEQLRAERASQEQPTA